MTDYKLVPVEQIERVIYALEKFANDTLLGRNLAHELRELLSASPTISVALEQRKGSGYWQEIPKNGGADWTGFDG